MASLRRAVISSWDSVVEEADGYRASRTWSSAARDRQGVVMYWTMAQGSAEIERRGIEIEFMWVEGWLENVQEQHAIIARLSDVKWSRC